MGVFSSSECKVRVDSTYYSTTEKAQRAQQEEQCKHAVSEKSATQCKFRLLGINARGQTKDAKRQFIVVNIELLNDLFAQRKCGTCGAGTLTITKATYKSMA